MIAAISSDVATGRRMKRRDGFTHGSTACWISCRKNPAASLAAPSTMAARAFAGRGRGTALRTPACSRDPHLRAVTQPVGAINDDHLPRLQPVHDRDPLTIARTQRHRLHRDRIVRFDQIYKGSG